MTDLAVRRVRVTMWTVVDGRPQDDERILGNMPADLFAEQMVTAGGVELHDGMWQHIYAGTVYRYRAEPTAG